MEDLQNIQGEDEYDNHSDGTICPFFAPDQVRTAASVHKAGGVYHGDGTRCSKWKFTSIRTASRPGTSLSDSSPAISPRKAVGDKIASSTMPPAPVSASPRPKFTTPDYAVPQLKTSSSATPAVHPNLRRIFPSLQAVNITLSWITSSLVPSLTAAYGERMANNNLNNNSWPEIIEGADLLIQALARSEQDPDFAQKYHTALMRRNNPIRGVGRDGFCDKLAEQGANFAIGLWMILESREKGSLVMDGRVSEESGMEETQDEESGDGSGDGDEMMTD